MGKFVNSLFEDLQIESLGKTPGGSEIHILDVPVTQVPSNLVILDVRSSSYGMSRLGEFLTSLTT